MCDDVLTAKCEARARRRSELSVCVSAMTLCWRCSDSAGIGGGASRDPDADPDAAVDDAAVDTTDDVAVSMVWRVESGEVEAELK